MIRIAEAETFPASKAAFLLSVEQTRIFHNWTFIQKQWMLVLMIFTSESLKNRLSGRILISVNVQLHKPLPSKVIALLGSPCLYASPNGST